MILYTDIDPYCCEVLRARVADGGLLPGEVWERDIRTLTESELRAFTQIHLFCGIGGFPLGLAWAGWPRTAAEEFSIVTGGFPCQDISSAGRGAGLSGARSGLFWEMMRVVENRKPSWVFAENVGALSKRGMDSVVGAMESRGYSVADPIRVGDWAFGAPHERERWFIVAVANRDDDRERTDARRGQSRQASEARHDACGRGASLGHTGHEHESERTRGAGRVRGERPPVGQLDSGAGAACPFCGYSPCPDRYGCPNCHGEGLEVGDGQRAGLEGHRPDAGQSEVAEPGHAGDSTRTRGWVCGYGPEQHEWEAPRVVESPLACAVHGVSRRVASYLRREGVRATGNAVVPQQIAAIARGMIAFSTEARA